MGSVRHYTSEDLLVASTYSTAQLKLVDDPSSEIVPYVAELSSDSAVVFYSDPDMDCVEKFIEEEGYSASQVDSIQDPQKVRQVFSELFDQEINLGEAGSTDVGETPQPSGPESLR